MRYSLCFAALMAAAMAAPVVKVVEVDKEVTKVVTAGTAQATPPPAVQPAGTHEVVTPIVHSVVVVEGSKPAAPAAPAAPQTAAPAAPAAPAPVTSTPSTSGEGGGFLQGAESSAAPSIPTATPAAVSSGSSDPDADALLATMNSWRTKYGLGLLAWDHELYKLSHTVGKNGQGSQQKHSLDPNTEEGQVITPGVVKAASNLDGTSPFGLAMISWLCEKDTDTELNVPVKVCPLVTNVLNMQYDTSPGEIYGHHNILIDPKYTKVGIAFFQNPHASATSEYQGLWVATLDV